jgi:hypothetical protein
MARLSSPWKLLLVSRLDAFCTCLSATDYESLNCVLSSPAARADFQTLEEAGVDGASALIASDTHLERNMSAQWPSCVS